MFLLLRLSAAFGNQPPAAGGFGTHTHHSSISQRPHETQVPPPSAPSPAEHPDPPGKEQGCLVCQEGLVQQHPQSSVQQSKGPGWPWPGPTQGLGDAPASPTGTGQPMVGTSPCWLWEQHGTQGDLVNRDSKELLWLYHRVFPQRKPARLNERISPFTAPVGASGRVPASQRNLAAGKGDHETSAQPLDKGRERVLAREGNFGAAIPDHELLERHRVTITGKARNGDSLYSQP